jgi:molybdopterin converting factor small subunit
MAVTIYIPLIHRHLSNDVETIKVEGNTVGQCLEQLVKEIPSMNEAIYNKNGDLQHLIEIFVNSKSAHPGELAHPIQNGDDIHIITLLSGG